MRPVVQRCLLDVPRETIEEILFGESILEQANYASASTSALSGPLVRTTEEA